MKKGFIVTGVFLKFLIAVMFLLVLIAIGKLFYDGWAANDAEEALTESLDDLSEEIESISAESGYVASEKRLSVPPGWALAGFSSANECEQAGIPCVKTDEALPGGQHYRIMQPKKCRETTCICTYDGEPHLFEPGESEEEIKTHRDENVYICRRLETDAKLYSHAILDQLDIKLNEDIPKRGYIGKAIRENKGIQLRYLYFYGHEGSFSDVYHIESFDDSILVSPHTEVLGDRKDYFKECGASSDTVCEGKAFNAVVPPSSPQSSWVQCVPQEGGFCEAVARERCKYEEENVPCVCGSSEPTMANPGDVCFKGETVDCEGIRSCNQYCKLGDKQGIADWDCASEWERSICKANPCNINPCYLDGSTCGEKP